MTDQQQMIGFVRMAAASLAIDWLQPKHRIVQVVLLVLGGVAVWQEVWWAVVLVVLVMIWLFVTYRVLVRVINWVGTPKELRALRDLQDGIKAEFERVDFPTGPLAVTLFAWRLARGKKPHEQIATRIPEAAANIQRLVQGALGPQGIVPPSATP